MEYINNKTSRNSDNNIDKLPFFLNKSGSPKSWFQLLESKFDFSALSSLNKFYLTISCLPPDILKLLSDDLVDASTSCNPYNYLKDLLIDHYKMNPNDAIKNYFSKHSQTGLVPSEYLFKAIRELESQYPGITKDNDQIMRQSFLSGLPPDVQKIVNGISNIELSKLADFADKICEKQPTKPIEKPKEPVVDDKTAIASLTAEVAQLRSQLKSLQDRFDRLDCQVNPPKTKPQSRQQAPLLKSNSRPSSPSHHYDSSYAAADKPKPRNHCFYHMKYGPGAQKCQLGCTYLPKSYDLKISSICIHHARNNCDTSQCVPGCTRFTSFNGINGNAR